MRNVGLGPARNISVTFEDYILDPNVFWNVMRTSRHSPERTIADAITSSSRSMREELREVSRTIASVKVILRDDIETTDSERTQYFEHDEE